MGPLEWAMAAVSGLLWQIQQAAAQRAWEAAASQASVGHEEPAVGGQLEQATVAGQQEAVAGHGLGLGTAPGLGQQQVAADAGHGLVARM